MAFALLHWLKRPDAATRVGGIIYLLRFRNYEYSLEILRVIYGTVVGVFLLMKRPVALFLLRIYFIVIAATLLLVLLRVIALALRIHTSLALVQGFTQVIVQTGFDLMVRLFP
jgi:hypothetical protein